MIDGLPRTFDRFEPPSVDDLDAAFADFLRLDVANGDASPDTIRGYRTQLLQWAIWCLAHAVNLASATPDHVKGYRQDLVSRGFKASSIAHNLTIVRRFYQAAVGAGLRRDNPATGIRPPRDKRAVEDFGCLSAGERHMLLSSSAP